MFDEYAKKRHVDKISKMYAIHLTKKGYSHGLIFVPINERQLIVLAYNNGQIKIRP